MAEPKKRGRPSAYRPEFVDQALKLCRLGATDKELADFFGVSQQTLNAWKGSHPDFLESLKAGKQLADAEVADKLFRRACGYTHKAVKIFNDQGRPLVVDYDEHYPPDTTACIFWLKNRRPDLWRDKPEGKSEDDSADTPRKIVFEVVDGRVSKNDDAD